MALGEAAGRAVRAALAVWVTEALGEAPALPLAATLALTTELLGVALWVPECVPAASEALERAEAEAGTLALAPLRGLPVPPWAVLLTVPLAEALSVACAVAHTRPEASRAQAETLASRVEDCEALWEAEAEGALVAVALPVALAVPLGRAGVSEGCSEAEAEAPAVALPPEKLGVGAGVKETEALGETVPLRVTAEVGTGVPLPMALKEPRALAVPPPPPPPDTVPVALAHTLALPVAAALLLLHTLAEAVLAMLSVAVARAEMEGVGREVAVRAIVALVRADTVKFAVEECTTLPVPLPLSVALWLPVAVKCKGVALGCGVPVLCALVLGVEEAQGVLLAVGKAEAVEVWESVSLLLADCVVEAVTVPVARAGEGEAVAQVLTLLVALLVLVACGLAVPSAVMVNVTAPVALTVGVPEPLLAPVPVALPAKVPLGLPEAACEGVALLLAHPLRVAHSVLVTEAEKHSVGVIVVHAEDVEDTVPLGLTLTVEEPLTLAVPLATVALTVLEALEEKEEVGQAVAVAQKLALAQAVAL